MRSTPVICGIDLGSWSFKLCVFNGQKFEVLTNEANFRETPSLVGFTEAQRLIGQSALIKLKTNFANTIRAPHRLLNMHKHPHLLAEELKYEKSNFNIKDDELRFSVAGKNGVIEVTPQQILITLFSKLKSLIQVHNFSLSIAYLSVPTYLGQQQRITLLKCGELALNRPIRLLDDWIALSIQYTYNRIKQLKVLEQMRYIQFIDVGYSKISLYLVQFTRFQGRLLDWQYLPYTGCKNIDHLLVEYYSSLFQAKYQQNILNNSKAYIKLLDAVQKQRAVLSANNEHHINLEYLLADQDLIYNMQRQEFQTIIVPILADIAAAFASIQSRNSAIPIYAVELMGGASRIPCVQNMAAKIFGIEPSRSLNQSQSIAVGSTIFGALQRKLINLQFSYDSVSTKQIMVKWANEKHIIFTKTTKPTQCSLNIGSIGLVKMTIYINQQLSNKQIGRLQFKSPNKITFTLNQNKIISAKLSLHQFELYELGHKPQQKWKSLLLRENEMSKIDERMKVIYELTNQYESKVYWIKNKYESFKDQSVGQEIRKRIQSQIKLAIVWIQQSHNQKIKGTQNQLANIENKIKEIIVVKKMCEQVQSDKNKKQELQVVYKRLSERISSALELNLDEESRERVMEIVGWAGDGYQKMEGSNWRSNELTLDNIEEAIIMVQILVNK